MAITLSPVSPGGCSPASMIKDSVRKRIHDEEECEGECSEQQQQVTKKSVSFCEQVRARQHLHVDDFSDDELEQCWYDESDFKSFKYDAWVTASLVEEGILKQDTNKICTRGVEMFVRPIAEVRRGEIDAARDVLLLEQELQWVEGIYDVEALADLYKAVADRSRSEALEYGRRDELER